MGRLDIEPSWNYSPKDIFTEPEKRTIEAWAYASFLPEDVAVYLNISVGTASNYGNRIRDKMDRGKGTDRNAKAVTTAALKGWIDPAPFPDQLERKLTKREHSVITQRVIGFTREEVSAELNIPKEEVAEDLEAMQSLIGCDNDYGVIAWVILKGLKNKATTG
ncbi:MAG: hypothetical protein UV59_C0040G0005 [Candidatus Gottesmanbacteria bacterium GW2011_GWA1_43_11]|uniref:Uncharacterized protein n=1 Tax=Candidatus Gottesmanbacteria bacterium GW2011_GWA1_43_11 TaxID=1618436 RepID=A0A0G1F956_9BACT|nr:MAG: hypothetical protein UV59_C0040G0005 [Candidatus Gottesmanbacteria bacterium GW2011_GWA1_43_11]